MFRGRRFGQLSVLLSVIVGVLATPAAADVSIGLRTTGVGAAVDMVPTGQFTSCNSSGFCFYHFAPGTTVTLRALPSANGGTFNRWLGACAGSGPICTVTLDVNKSATARFSPVQLFTDEQAGRGSVSVSPLGRSCGGRCWEYGYATTVTVSAQADPGWAFRYWAGFCGPLTSASTCTFTMFANVETSPVFRCTGEECSTSQPIVREVKTKVHVRGSGYVKVNGATCRSSACEFAYNRGKAVVLRAYGAGFRRWTGWCSGTTPRCQFSAFKDAFNRPPDVTAVFG